ncbi:DUF3784 domain-containing protein [Clostridium sp. B9]|uniref:DUF3784 domain-containing protein n=1 Tax=Clostridium sp. B9 TaxID=3423224 RepID=UPI003D2F40C4
MKESSLISVLLLAFLAGGFLTFLGGIIKYFNAGDMINGFDENKHDKNKVSKLLGTDFLLSGLGVILLGIIGLFVNDNFYTLINILQICIIFIGLALSIFHFYKKCSKK